MVRHVTVRVGWHDNKWNGTICKDPKGNYYCRDNYSLLSPRVQKRFNLDEEENNKGKSLSQCNLQNYVPPCYWSINAFGDKKFKVYDHHPFADLKKYQNKFEKSVPPLEYDITKNTMMTWCFQLGFARNSAQRYVPQEELEHRFEHYQSELQKGKSLVYCYANYSNPLTGDDYKYALVGVGVVDSVSKPQKYQFSEDHLVEIRSDQGMRNFPEYAWQFPISVDSEFAFVLPFHEYLDWVEAGAASDKNERIKTLQEVVIPIEENIIPHFKYVSMHLTHDKALYLLYKIKKSLRKMKEHDVVDAAQLKAIDVKLDKMMQIAWTQRGRYPGFINATYVLVKNEITSDTLHDQISELRNTIESQVGSLSNLFEGGFSQLKDLSTFHLKIVRVLQKNKDVLRFLSTFDFSIPQFEEIKKIIFTEGVSTIKNNPYVILEKYHRGYFSEWNVDESDFGIKLYQIDTALIPDINYSDWDGDSFVDSPGRIRAVIVQILLDAAKNGNSCLTRDDILQEITNYPLFYISDKLDMNIDKLLEYEKQSIFKEKFVISDQFAKGTTIYQLKEIRKIEEIIENFVNRMSKKQYSLTKDDETHIDSIVSKEKSQLGIRLKENERRHLYRNCLKNGLFVLSGKAGSGKTSAIVNLIEQFLADKKTPIFVFTPTGKSNLVIRQRLKSKGITDENLLKISTIHRFLYSAVFDSLRSSGYGSFSPANNLNETAGLLVNLVSQILDNDLENLNSFTRISENFRFSPGVLIIDEASMVNEAMLAALFAMINVENLKHLIIVGDEKQLPPIGIGRPFVDCIYNLKKQNQEQNYIRLESNLRFDSSKGIGTIADIFESNKNPTPSDFIDVFNTTDETFEIQYFENEADIRKLITKTLKQISTISDDELPKMFGDVFSDSTTPILDKIQIITPRRVGNFASGFINSNVIKEKSHLFSPRTKLICEKNQYVWIEKAGRKKRILALANGSMGYIMPDGRVEFDELNDFVKDYGPSYEITKIKNQVMEDSYKIERDINIGYAITVHKSQGSDYEHVIFVIPEISPHLMRELLYTAFTRTKIKLHLFVNKQLKDEFPTVLINAHQNSTIEERKTMLFGQKNSPMRPYELQLKNGERINVRSKIEYIIAKSLDDAQINFVYEPQKFLVEHRIIPDFEISINNTTYILEHLGNMEDFNYRSRWNRKRDIYKKLGLDDFLITTSEDKSGSNVGKALIEIINHIRTGNLKKTEADYSKHHYYL